MSTNLDALISFALRGAERERVHPRKWSSQDDAFLKVNLGYLSEEQIGKTLGRSVKAVHLRWKRDLNLTAPSKAPGILTGNQIADMLGLDIHKIMGWVAEGFLPGRMMAGGRKIRLIDRQDFMKWVLDPQSWMYFDITKVQDGELKKQLEEAAKQWGDEWWSTAKVAKYHGVSTSDVKRHIKLGRIKATQIKYSYGGRHPSRYWSYWFVLKTEAISIDLTCFRRYKPNSSK